MVLNEKRTRIFFSSKSLSDQQGFILVTALLFLCLMAWMVLMSLEITDLGLKVSRNDRLISQQFQVAEVGLKRAEDQLPALLQKKITSLQGRSSYAGYPFNYVIKQIAIPFCNNQKIAYYYFITVSVEQIEGNPLVLQSTYALKGKEICREGEPHLSREGRSSWRELTVY